MHKSAVWAGQRLAGQGGADGVYAGPGRSPDCADAMVWALWARMIEARGAPLVSLA